MHIGIAFHRAEHRHMDRAGCADARDIIAHQIHNHQVFGPILGTGGQLCRQRRIVPGITGAFAGPLDRPRLDMATTHRNEAFR